MSTEFKNYEDYPSLLCAKDLEKIFPISRAGVYNLMNSEGFPILQIGGRKLVPKDKLLAWMEKNTAANV